MPSRRNHDDRRIWEEELEAFVPDRVFDAHVHLLDKRHLRNVDGAFLSWADTDFADLTDCVRELLPGRRVHFLVLGTPSPGIDVKAHNRWIAEQLRGDASSRMHRLVTPQCRVDELARDHSEWGFMGLKPYRLFSKTGDPHQCRIADFLPLEQLELANERQLWITMHLSRFHGCADEQNLADLENYTTKRFPQVRWILAHCARSFTYWPIRQAIDRLRQLPNIWYDVSAVTDVRPLITLFSRENIRRVLFGSDLVDATIFRGKYVSLGRAWQGFDADHQAIQFPHCDGRPILCFYEQLLAMKHAAEVAELSHNDVENIFWRNAATDFHVDDLNHPNNL